MNREQMIAWLCLEGWEPCKRDDSAVRVLSVMRGDARISQSGSYTPRSAWASHGAVKVVVLAALWSEFTENCLERIYERAARLL